MKRAVYLENISPWAKLLLLFGILLLSAMVAALMGLLIGKAWLGVDLLTLADVVSNPQTEVDIAFLKFYQLINQIGFFIVPVAIYCFLVTSSSTSYLMLNRSPNATNLLVMGMVVFTILPFINFLGEFNQQMDLPKAFDGLENWMKEKEEQAFVLTETLLKTKTTGGLILNLIIVALVPALGEELLFRGVILRLFNDITRNAHWAIIISAFLFAALHLQFYGFLPRFALGVALGYSLVITRNLWVPIFIHFVNNTASVIVFYLHYNGYIDIPMKDFGSVQSPVYIIGSLLITIWLFIIVYRRERNTITSWESPN